MKPISIIGIGLILFAFLSQSRKQKIYVPAKPQANTLQGQDNYMAWIAYATTILTQAEKIWGSIDQAVDLLWGPGGPFYQTPVPEYDAGSQFWNDVNQQYA